MTRRAVLEQMLAALIPALLPVGKHHRTQFYGHGYRGGYSE